MADYTLFSKARARAEYFAQKRSERLQEHIQRIVCMHAYPKWLLPTAVQKFDADSYELREPPPDSQVCDCGALKARTTHVDWCSTRGGL